jgi:hypothetical protein
MWPELRHEHRGLETVSGRSRMLAWCSPSLHSYASGNAEPRAGCLLISVCYVALQPCDTAGNADPLLMVEDRKAPSAELVPDVSEVSCPREKLVWACRVLIRQIGGRFHQKE